VTTDSSLHVLLATIGSAGDVNPFVAIGLELRRRGHRVTLVTNPFFAPAAKRAGLDFIGLGAAEDYRRTVDDPDLWDPRTGFRVIARRVVMPAIQPLYEILSRNLASNEIVVAHGQAFGAHLVHEKHGVPFVTVQLQPAAFRTMYDAPLMPGWIPRFLRPSVYTFLDYLVLDREFARGLNAFRSKLGLPKIHKIFASWIHSPQKSLGLFPDWFAAPQPDWPSQTSLTGFVFLHEGPRPLAPDLSAFLADGEPPIVFTPGTAMRRSDLFFQASVQASMEMGRRALLLTQYPDQLPPRLPDGVAASIYVPFETLLPRCAALVHHGGIGTAAQALAAGIPQLVRPMTFDQPDNAARLKRLGVASSIRPDHYRARPVADALNFLLTSQAVSDNCRHFASVIDPARGLQDACDAIETVAAGPHAA